MAVNDGLPKDDDVLKPTEVDLSAADDGGVEIEVVDDTPERDRGRQPLNKPVEEPTDEELDSYTEGVRKRIKELTHARHDERREKERLLRQQQDMERMATVLANENRHLKQYVNVGEQQFVATIQQSLEKDLNSVKAKLRAAHEAFDTESIVSAQDELAEIRAKLEQTKNFRPAPVQQEQPVLQTAQVSQQPAPLDDKLVRWQARNQWFGAPDNEEMTSFSLGLHQKLVREGVDPRSDDYYAKIDARLRDTFPQYFGTKSASAGKPASSVVAPATRTTGPKKVQLSPHALALAKKFGLTPQQYAMEVAKLESKNV